MKTDLIYGVEDRPPFKDALFAALQHLLAISARLSSLRLPNQPSSNTNISIPSPFASSASFKILSPSKSK